MLKDLEEHINHLPGLDGSQDHTGFLKTLSTMVSMSQELIPDVRLIEGDSNFGFALQQL